MVKKGYSLFQLASKMKKRKNKICYCKIQNKKDILDCYPEKVVIFNKEPCNVCKNKVCQSS